MPSAPTLSGWPIDNLGEPSDPFRHPVNQTTGPDQSNALLSRCSEDWLDTPPLLHCTKSFEHWDIEPATEPSAITSVRSAG